ncbi:hypothetical protein BN2476_1540005 [Paraburkholderia piptadeniae]|uniref:Uncharacterized protein n=1 Tax=Paraburkholderia piptadeniae TaxID=1701573 RepID=A0A1N7SWT3_9BURK|nr:hypothetical protein BN2476_1540005 [Paraburkholderia piptadeniae]
MFVANALAKRLTRFTHLWHGLGHRTFQRRMSVVNMGCCVAQDAARTWSASCSEGVLCDANAYTQFAAKGRWTVRCRKPQFGCTMQVRRLSSALATNMGQYVAA